MEILLLTHSTSSLLCCSSVVVLHSHGWDHHCPNAMGGPVLYGGCRQRRYHSGQRRAVVMVTVVKVMVGIVAMWRGWCAWCGWSILKGLCRFISNRWVLMLRLHSARPFFKEGGRWIKLFLAYTKNSNSWQFWCCLMVITAKLYSIKNKKTEHCLQCESCVYLWVFRLPWRP